jgi:hypothetical protein
MCTYKFEWWFLRTYVGKNVIQSRESKREEASLAVDLQPPSEVVEYLDNVKTGAYIYMVGTSWRDEAVDQITWLMHFLGFVISVGHTLTEFLGIMGKVDMHDGAI